MGFLKALGGFLGDINEARTCFSLNIQTMGFSSESQGLLWEPLCPFSWLWLYQCSIGLNSKARGVLCFCVHISPRPPPPTRRTCERGRRGAASLRSPVCLSVSPPCLGRSRGPITCFAQRNVLLSVGFLVLCLLSSPNCTTLVSKSAYGGPAT